MEDQTPQESEQSPSETPEELAFKLTYYFHEKARGDIKQDAVRGVGMMAGALGTMLFLPAFSMAALVGIAGYCAWDIVQTRKRNLLLRDVFNNTVEGLDENLKFRLQPLADALKNVEPFGKNDLNKAKHQLVGNYMNAAISFGLVLLSPVMLAPVVLAGYAAYGVGREDKMTTIKVAQAAREAGENLKNANPDLQLKLG